MKKVFLCCLLLLKIVFDLAAQQTDSTKKLVPVESLLSRVKADTSRYVEPLDTAKVDTVYIDNPMNVIKAGANLADALGMCFVSYERVVAFMGTVQMKVEFLGTYNPFQNASYIKETYDNINSMTGIGFVPEGRYYGSDRYAPKGLFVGLYVPLRFASVTVPQTIEKEGLTYSLPTDKLSYSLLGVGFDCGYQFVFSKRWTVEGLLGFAIAKGTFSEDYYTATKVVNGVQTESKLAIKDGTIGKAYYPRLEIGVGWAFK